MKALPKALAGSCGRERNSYHRQGYDFHLAGGRRDVVRGKAFVLLDYTISAVSCCRFIDEDRALSNAWNIVVAELVKKIQQHRVLANIENRQVLRKAITFTCLPSSPE